MLNCKIGYYVNSKCFTCGGMVRLGKYHVDCLHYFVRGWTDMGSQRKVPFKRLLSRRLI